MERIIKNSNNKIIIMIFHIFSFCFAHSSKSPPLIRKVVQSCASNLEDFCILKKVMKKINFVFSRYYCAWINCLLNETNISTESPSGNIHHNCVQLQQIYSVNSLEGYLQRENALGCQNYALHFSWNWYFFFPLRNKAELFIYSKEILEMY